MAIYPLPRIEMIHVSMAICVGTVVVNSLIALLKKWLRSTPKIVPDMHWEREVISGDSIEEADFSEAAIKQPHSRPATTFDLERGFLTSDIPQRTAYVDSKKDVSRELVAVLKDLRYSFDDFTYLGFYVGDRRQQSSLSLYARRRKNGITICQGEIVSLHVGRTERYLRIRLSKADYTLLTQAGWTIKSPESWYDKFYSLISRNDNTNTCLMRLPRDTKELETIYRTVFEAAILATTTQQCV